MSVRQSSQRAVMRSVPSAALWKVINGSKASKKGGITFAPSSVMSAGSSLVYDGTSVSSS